MALGCLLGESRAHVPGEVAAVGFIHGFVDSLAEEVPVTAANDPLRDKDHHHTQPLEFLLVPDALGLISGEAANTTLL